MLYKFGKKVSPLKAEFTFFILAQKQTLSRRSYNIPSLTLLTFKYYVYKTRENDIKPLIFEKKHS